MCIFILITTSVRQACTLAILAALFAVVFGAAEPKFPNPYNMMAHGKSARPYMSKKEGVKMYNNYMYGYKMPKYGAYGSKFY